MSFQTRSLVLGALLLLPAAPGAFAHEAPSEAISSLAFKIALAPDAADLYLQRAELLRQVDHFEEARLDLERFLALEPGAWEAHFLLGRVLLESGDVEAALSELNRSLEVEPHHLFARILRARALLALDRPLEAAVDYTDVITADPMAGPTYYLELAEAYIEAEPSRVEDAIAVLDAATDTLGTLLVLEVRALDYQQARGDDEAALEHVDRVLGMAPRAEKWMVKRGEILLRLGRNREAEAAYRGALQSLEQRGDGRNAPARAELAERLAERLRAGSGPWVRPKGCRGRDAALDGSVREGC